jgi:hypothetical protein
MAPAGRGAVAARSQLCRALSSDGAALTVHCPGAPSFSFPLPSAPGSGPPIEIEARDGASADQDNPDVGGPGAHRHYTLRAGGP